MEKCDSSLNCDKKYDKKHELLYKKTFNLEEIGK